MPSTDLDHDELIKALTDNFNILADEVQLLSDRKTILEHKLRFAHEQYQQLADKYASGDSEIANTLAKLQLPPDLQITPSDRSGFVPLPLRKQTNPKQQTAVVIRDGRRAAQRLAAFAGKGSGSTASGNSISGTSSLRFSARRTSLSTVLEQDFTVPGKKGSLSCPFTPPVNHGNLIMNGTSSQASGTPGSEEHLTPSDLKDPVPQQPGDPICAAMYTEAMASPPPSANGSGAKCPIRFLDQHSPEEVARYFETHKHEIPRSHEVCVKRYQRNENDIRKLDAKYGNLVSMIQGLGQKHQPMLPEKEEEEYEDPEEERISNERVENWAHAVSTDGIGHEEAAPEPEIEDDRESRFDRPLKEIRVGESPSRPWGISIPIFDPPEDQRPESPPPAPVSADHLPKLSGKCPFDHGAKVDIQETLVATPFRPVERSAGNCPFPYATSKQVREDNDHPPRPQPAFNQPLPQPTFTQVPQPAVQSQPAFINPPEQKNTSVQLPQMIFTGPVFIGYPMEQAMAFIQQYRST